MGCVKDMYYDFTEPSSYNDEYFYFKEEEYRDMANAYADEMYNDDDEQLEDEYNAVELYHAMSLIQEIAADNGIECKELVEKLNQFIQDYEDTFNL